MEKSKKTPVQFVVCEPVRVGIEHVPFNSAFLVSLRSAYPKERIVFLGEASHLQFITEALPCEIVHSIEFGLLDIAPRHASVMSRFLPDWRVLKQLRSNVKNPVSNCVIFTSINASLLWGLSLPVNRRQWQIILGVIHAMPFLVRSSSRYKPRFLQSAFQFALQFKAGLQCELVVLENPIASELELVCPAVKGRVSVIDHPVPLEAFEFNQKTKRQPYNIGFIGLATPQKGFERFVKWAMETSKDDSDLFAFHVIGRLHDVYNKNAPDWELLWSVKPSDKPLDRRDYLEGISQLDFVFFCPDGKHYDVTASGIVLDCIAHGIPLITNNNRIISNIQSQVGEIGIVLDEFSDDWIDRLSGLLEDLPDSRYENMQKNLSQARILRSPDNIGKKIIKVIERK